MKRIVAKEFLLLVGCLIVLLLIALFGWIRNAWFEHRADSIGREQVDQSRALDSLGQLTVPRNLDFLDLFEPEFVRHNYSVFLISPFWTMDPFLQSMKNIKTPPTLAEFRAARAEQYPTIAGGSPILRNDEGNPFSTQGAEPTFNPTNPFTVVVDDPFQEFGGHADLPSPSPRFNRRLLLCLAKALDNQRYLSSNRTKQLAAVCGLSDYDFGETKSELRAARMQFESARKLSAGDEEVYTSTTAGGKVVSWIEALQARGVPKGELTERLSRARTDTSTAPELLIAVRGLLCDTPPFTQLRNGFDYLKEHRALRCNFDALLYTLQNKAVPPNQEALDAFAKQKTMVYELRNQQNTARASLWSATKQWEVVKWSAIVLFLLVWPLRLLVLGTRWAVRTLRAAE